MSIDHEKIWPYYRKQWYESHKNKRKIEGQSMQNGSSKLLQCNTVERNQIWKKILQKCCYLKWKWKKKFKTKMIFFHHCLFTSFNLVKLVANNLLFFVTTLILYVREFGGFYFTPNQQHSTYPYDWLMYA